MRTSLLMSAALFIAPTGLLTAAEPGNLGEALAQGKVSLNARLRYEGVEQTGLKDAEALTLRTHLGFATAAWLGSRALLEVENIVAADGDRYSQAGLNPGGAGRAVVADPVGTEINQALLSFAHEHSTLTVGRQRLALDNARFVGDVGWRQNMQTFDAVVAQDRSIERTTLTYAYVDRVNRVFGDKHAQGKWTSRSHLANASYNAGAAGTFTAYAYWLDFRNSAANSCATYGVSYAGSAPLTAAVKLTARAELATQSDSGASTLDYSARYSLLELGLAAKPGAVLAGYEVLGSGHNVGFKTPLATLHAFNGWADLFLSTPAAGLRDTYLKGTANLPAAITGTAFVHWFRTDATSARLGTEVDLMVSRKFGPAVTALAKYADFRRDGTAYPNVRKIWVQVEFVR